MRTTTHACLILHNVCIDRGDAISKKLDLTLDPNTQARRPREEVRKLLQMTTCSTVKDTSSEAQKVRNALCKKLWLEKNTEKSLNLKIPVTDFSFEASSLLPKIRSKSQGFPKLLLKH